MSIDQENIAIDTYKNNLLYLKKHQQNIYEKLLALDTAIENGYYQNKYELVFNNGYFDVLEVSSNNYLYSTDSNKYAEMVSNSLNKERESNAYAAFKKINIKDKDLKTYAELKIYENNLSGLAPIINYIDNNITDISHLHLIKKFIFFGIGLGNHIVQVDKKIGSELYLIIEDDLELFKLSLFVTPYYDIAINSELMFSIFDSKEDFLNIAQTFLDKEFYHNHYLKYFQMLSHSEAKLKDLHIKIASQSHYLFFYDAILEQYTRPLKYIKNNMNFLNILHKYTTLEKHPVLFLAAGPSLQKNLNWIRKNQECFIIVALSATLSTLEKEGIIPDIVTHIDGFDASVPHFEKLVSIDFLKDTMFLMSARTPKAIIDCLKEKNIFFFENGTNYKASLGNLAAPCVGSTTYLILLAIGVHNMYLLGLDLALDSTGTTHSQGHEQIKTLDIKSSESHSDTMSFQNQVIQTDGNFQKTVYTLPTWIASIESINDVSLGFKSNDQNVYNLSDGAAFSNTIKQKLNKINISSFRKIDKQQLSTELLISFTEKCSSSMNTHETLLLKHRFKYAKKLKVKIIKQQKKKFNSHEEFLNSLKVLFKTCSGDTSTKAHDLSLVYQEYFKIVYSYIFDFFNTEGLSDKQKHSNELNKLLSLQLLRIIDFYIEELSFSNSI